MIIYRDAIGTFVEYLKFIRVKITRYVVLSAKLLVGSRDGSHGSVQNRPIQNMVFLLGAE